VSQTPAVTGKQLVKLLEGQVTRENFNRLL
jgi:hypothetical protein